MFGITAKVARSIMEIVIVTYAAGCALIFTPFAVGLVLDTQPRAGYSHAELVPLLLCVRAFIFFALLCLVYDMTSRTKPKIGEMNVAR